MRSSNEAGQLSITGVVHFHPESRLKVREGAEMSSKYPLKGPMQFAPELHACTRHGVRRCRCFVGQRQLSVGPLAQGAFVH